MPLCTHAPWFLNNTHRTTCTCRSVVRGSDYYQKVLGSISNCILKFYRMTTWHWCLYCVSIIRHTNQLYMYMYVCVIYLELLDIVECPGREISAGKRLRARGNILASRFSEEQMASANLQLHSTWERLEKEGQKKLVIHAVGTKHMQ